MIRRARLLFGILALGGTAFAADTPQLLITCVKGGPAKVEAQDEIMANYIARELDEDGRVVPIVWSLTDPVFRDAVGSGKLAHHPDLPTLPECLVAARTLQARYVLVFSSRIKGDDKIGVCALYSEGRVIWKDTEQISITKTDSAIDSRSDSIAHTWGMKLETQPLRALVPRPKAVTPAVGGGQAPIVTTGDPPPEAPEKFDPAEIAAQVQKLRQDGRLDAALLLVRDSIDQHPTEASLRLLLVHVLEWQGNYKTAADEAQRGSEVVPTSRELRFAAVQDLLLSGETDVAKNALNEMLARGAEDPPTLLLEGQIALAAGDYKQASTSLNKAIQTSPTPDAYFWRAVTRALLGGADGVVLDLQALAKTPMTPAALADAYPTAMKMLAGSCQNDLTQALNVFTQASLSGTQVKDQADEMARRAAARGAFLEQAPVPAEFKDSHGKWLLAQKLLTLALIDLQEFVKNGSDDAMTDARINLGEAMKQSKAAQDAFAVETGTSRNATASIHNL